jgi:hypothetical protein
MQLGKEKDNFPVKSEQNGNWPTQVDKEYVTFQKRQLVCQREIQLLNSN